MQPSMPKLWRWVTAPIPLHGEGLALLIQRATEMSIKHATELVVEREIEVAIGFCGRAGVRGGIGTCAGSGSFNLVEEKCEKVLSVLRALLGGFGNRAQRHAPALGFVQ